MSNICLNFGAKIRQHRATKGYSTQELAQRLDVSVGRINNIENAKNDVFEFELLLALINELDMSLFEVFEDYTPKVETKNINGNSIISIELNSTTSTDTLVVLKEYISKISTLFVKLCADKGNDNKFIKILSNHIVDELNFIYRMKQL
jgi:transcriptional regulator with XRE-family HTH domain